MLMAYVKNLQEVSLTFHLRQGVEADGSFF